MSHRRLLFAICLVVSVSVCGCDLGESLTPDPQFVKLYFSHYFRNSVDTFHGTLTKDLAADGIVTVPFWLTTEKQDSILAEVIRNDFFSLPDTIRGNPAIHLIPDPGPQTLRIETEGRTHQVVWYVTSENVQIFHLSQFIRELIESTPEYRNLPPPRGGYL